MENYERFLPIGTVVMLKGGTKRAMITGFCSVAENNKDKTFDYSGCIFPEGYLSSNQVCLFDHEQIEKVYHLGLVDDEEKLFKARLNSFINEIKKADPQTNEPKNVVASENISANNDASQVNFFQTPLINENKES